MAGLVTGFVLAAPVVSGDAAPSGHEAAGDELVVMGLDGAPTSATFASAAVELALHADGTVRVEATASRGERPAASVPAPAPVEVPPPAAVPEPVVPEPTVPEPAAQQTPAPERAIARPTPPTTAAPRTALPAAPAPPPPPAAVVAGSDRAGQVLALVNQERAAAGCGPLVADSRLAAVATAHSADMRDQDYFDHTNLAGQSPFDRAESAGVPARAENIARGQGDAPAVMDAWMDSAGRANILDCSLTRLGVGIADGAGGPWWTQLFA